MIPWTPEASHAVARGRPWHPTGSCMGIHGRACGIPRAPTQGVVGSHASCRATEHGLPRGNPRLKGLKKLHMRYILRLTMFGHPAWAPTWVPTRAPMWAPMGSHVGSHVGAHVGAKMGAHVAAHVRAHMRAHMAAHMGARTTWAPTWAAMWAPMWAAWARVGSHGVPRGVPRGIPCRCCHGNTRESPRDYERYIPRR